MPLYTATKRLFGTSLSSWVWSFVCTWKISKPAACACAHAVDHAKFKTTKIYSQGILVDYTKICTNENFPLYGIRKLAGSSVMTHRSWSLTKTQQDNRKHQFVLNWLRNVIKCTLNYIPEPIKHTKTSVFCYAVTFHSEIRLGSASVCHDKTTCKLSLTSSEVWFFYVLPPLGYLVLTCVELFNTMLRENQP